jgi:CrcB protein
MVALGGALGSIARYGVAAALLRGPGTAVPYATGIVNVLGCAIAGVLAGLLSSARITLTIEHRALIIAGVLGGFTTFSGFGLDLLTLVNEGRGPAAFVDLVVQVVGGLGLLALCYGVARGL